MKLKIFACSLIIELLMRKKEFVAFSGFVSIVNRLDFDFYTFTFVFVSLSI